MVEGIFAGIDVGNATTEVVLAKLSDGSVQVLDHISGATWGVKGDRRSLDGAVRLVQRLVSGADVHLSGAVVVPMSAVNNIEAVREGRTLDTGPLQLLSRGVPTGSGDGVGIGQPCPVEGLEGVPLGGVIVVVGPDCRFDRAAALINSGFSRGVDIQGVLVARDEGVLIGNRLEHSIPVIDDVPREDALKFELVAMEMCKGGGTVSRLSDPFWVVSNFGLHGEEMFGFAQSIGVEVSDSGGAAIGKWRGSGRSKVGEGVCSKIQWQDGSVSPLLESCDWIRASAPSNISSVALQGQEWQALDDLFVLDLGEVSRSSGVKAGSVGGDGVLISILRSDVSPGLVSSQVEYLSDALRVPVLNAGSEAAAGRAGALSTPGCPANATVVDIGAGTMELTTVSESQVVVGAGSMIDVAIARGFDVTRGVAELAKRGPAIRVATPGVGVDEKGSRFFLAETGHGKQVGQICVEGPRGLVPFTSMIGLDEWRLWRQKVKNLILATNIVRAQKGGVNVGDGPLVLVGGGAGDEEILGVVARSLSVAGVVGRGNIGGTLGHRFSVAFGALQIAAAGAASGGS